MQEDFGQEVFLTVHNRAGNDIHLDAAGLRVDFDVRLVNGFNRGTFTIYNLTDESIKSVVGDDRYVSVTGKLHGREFLIADTYYISNVLEEKVLPNSITTLYCYDQLRKEVLEKQLNITVVAPSLRRVLNQVSAEARFEGEIKYKSWPDGKLDHLSPRSVQHFHGSFQSIVNNLQKQYNFNFFTDNGDLICMYMPDSSDINYTELNDKEPDVVLDSLNMRANPKVGPASLFITSNLDSNIKPSAVLDATKLITVGVADGSGLETASDFLNHATVGYTKFQVIASQHKGSNYTKEWKTVATAIAASKGKRMPTFSWQQGI